MSATPPEDEEPTEDEEEPTEEEEEEITEEELDDIWNGLDEEEQDALLEDSDAESWDDLSAEDKETLLNDGGYIEDTGGEEEEEELTEEELDSTFDELDEEDQEALLEESDAESWDDLSEDEKRTLLEDGGFIESGEEDSGYTEEELDEIWDGLDEEEQDALLEDSDAESWDDLSPEEKLALLQDGGHVEEDAELGDGDGEDEPEAPEAHPLAVVEELPMEEGPNEGRGQVVVAGIEIPGAYQVRESGAGFESQYLEETSAGGGSEADYDFDEDATEGSDGGDSDEGEGEGEGDGGGSSDEGGEEPPMSLEIDAICSSPTMQELVDLRDQEDPFSVEIGEVASYDEMELDDLKREITGDKPFSYQAKITVKEWREYETEDVMDYFDFVLEDVPGGGTMGSSSGGEDVPSIDDVNPTEDWEQNGTPDDPTVLEGGEHNVGDDERMEHVILDVEDEPGSINADGDNWEIRDVGVRGAPEDTPMNVGTNGGAGRVDGVYLGEGTGGDAPSISADDGGGAIGVERTNAPDGIDASSPTTSSDGGSYETIAASGQTITISGGETMNNVLVDLTTGNGITIDFQGGGTLRNVGFEGIYRGGGFVIMINGGGQVLVENVYLGDGASMEGASFVHGPGGVFYHRTASANVTFRNCNVQGYTNNGFYCSNAHRNGGSVRWESCYARNNGVSTYRTSSSSDEIVNCVAHNDNTDYGPGYPTGVTESNGRPFWVWSPGGVTIQQCDFAAGTYSVAGVADGAVNWGSGNNVSGNVQGSSSPGGSPDLSPPQGVPMNAQVAASGESGGAPSVPGAGGGSPETTISDVWVDGAQTAIRAGRGDGDTNIEGAQVSNAGVGVAAESGTVNVSNSEIQASEPQAAGSGGEIESDGTNWGGDASPSAPGSVPLSAEEAAGNVNEENPGFGGDS